MISSKLNRNGQTVLPRRVRMALGLREGDEIVYTIEQDRVVITRGPPDDAFRVFSEWESDADSKAYATL